MLNQRAILASLSRNDLLALVDHFDLPAADRRVRDNLIHALAASRSTSLEAMLGRLSLAALTRICEDHDVALASRKKAARVQAIVQATQRSKAPARSGTRAPRPAAVPAPAAKAKKLPRAKVAKPEPRAKKRSVSPAAADELSSAVKQAEAIMQSLRSESKAPKKKQTAVSAAGDKKIRATKTTSAVPTPIKAKKSKKIPQLELAFALANELIRADTHNSGPSRQKSETSSDAVKLSDLSKKKKISPRDKKVDSVTKEKQKSLSLPATVAALEPKAAQHRPAPRFADAWPKPTPATHADDSATKKQNGAGHVLPEKDSKPDSIRRPQPHPSYRAASPAVADATPTVAAQSDAPSPAPAAPQSEECTTQPLRITMTTQSIKDALKTAPDELPRPLVPDAMAFVQTRLTKKCRSCQKPIEMRKCGVQRCSNMLLANPARKICAECLFERNTISMVDFNERLEEEAHCPHCNDAWETLS
jgi:hypothetical protein